MRTFLRAIESHLIRDCVVDAVPAVDSTNRVVKELGEAGAPEGTVFFAEMQTAGRGRMGRSFFSPAGSGLYFSILLRPKGTDPLRITAAAGVAVARAVAEVLGKELQIKWVNDLYLKNKKVCGILAEGIVSQRGLEYCVLGIGLNVFAPAEGFGVLQDIAGALLNTAPDDELRGKLAAAVLNHFFAVYQDVEDPEVLREYRRRSYLQGRTVTALRGGERIRGKVAGIADDYALLLETEDGLRAFSSGEVQLEDYR